jgi:hypothetical protein
VGLDNLEDLGGSLLSLLDGLLVVGVLAQERAEPGAELGQHLAVEE